MKIGVTGAQGFLGSRIVEYMKDENLAQRYSVTGYTRKTLDFTDRECVETVLQKDRPDILIHTAAVSDIKACADDPEMSEKVNVTGVQYLADVCKKSGIRLIFCSSDQVYMGSSVEMPHKEDEEKLLPPTMYGCQKLRAEKYIMRVCPDAVILRLSWMFAADFAGRCEHASLLANIQQAVRDDRKLVFPVYDFRSLTDVWEVVANMEKIFRAEGGIYNFGSENDLSTYELISSVLSSLELKDYLPEKNTQAFSISPRNLRMDMSKCRKNGITFQESFFALKKAAESVWI